MESLKPLVRVIDDDDAMRRSWAFLIEGEGWDVVTYSDALDFIASNDFQRPGCLVLDVRMPRMSGLELQDKMQELGIDLDRMKADIDHAVFKDKAVPFEKFSSIHPSKAAAGILEMAGYESLKSHSDAVFPSHIMLAVCHTSGSAGSDLLKSYGVTYNSLRDRFSTMGALQRTDSESETKKTFGAITDKLVELINPESKNITYTS